MRVRKVVHAFTSLVGGKPYRFLVFDDGKVEECPAEQMPRYPETRHGGA